MIDAYHHVEQNSLSIRLSTDGFSFSIHSPLTLVPVATVSFAIDPSLSMVQNLKAMAAQHSELLLTFHRVTILLSNIPATAVPLEHFRPEEAAQLFAQGVREKEQLVVCHNRLDNTGVALLFGVQKSLHDYLTAQFPTALIEAAVSPLLEQLTTKSRLGNSRKLYALLQRTRLTAFAYERGKLLLMNTFAYEETADVVFYLLYICKQLQFDQRRDELHLLGEGDKTAAQKELQKFVAKVMIASE